MNDTTDTREIELKRLAVELTISMLDNHSDDWDAKATADAYRTMYAALREK